MEPITPEHADEVWPHVDDARMWEFFPHLRPRSREDLRRTYERWSRGYREPDGAQNWENWLLRRKLDARLVGSAQLTILPRSRMAYVAYSVYAAERRRGYGREAVQKLIEHSRSAHTIDKLYAEMDVRNEASYRLAESLGFQRVEHIPGATDEYLYQLAL